MNIEEIKMDHFENFEELIKTCKMWIRDDDIDAYYRFFEFNCMKALVTAYEKEKEKREKLEYEAEEAEEYIKELKKYIEKYKIRIPMPEEYYNRENWGEEITIAQKEYIAVDKIKAKIEEYKNKIKKIRSKKLINEPEDTIIITRYAHYISVLQSLLEKE